MSVLKNKIMKPKEKAIDLVDKHYLILTDFNIHASIDSRKYYAKQCALIAVELHLEELSKMKLIFSDRELHYKYWQEVKQEIEIL